jgi:hypothetical protein
MTKISKEQLANVGAVCGKTAAFIAEYMAACKVQQIAPDGAALTGLVAALVAWVEIILDQFEDQGDADIVLLRRFLGQLKETLRSSEAAAGPAGDADAETVPSERPPGASLH